MPEPTNGELAIMLENMGTHVLDIKEQTVKTNGRVSKLEKGFWMIAGGLVVVSAIVAPLFLNMMKK